MSARRRRLSASYPARAPGVTVGPGWSRVHRRTLRPADRDRDHLAPLFEEGAQLGAAQLGRARQPLHLQREVGHREERAGVRRALPALLLARRPLAELPLLVNEPEEEE